MTSDFSSKSKFPLRVTFDTMTLADVVSPQDSQRGPIGVANARSVRRAIEDGRILGFFCETVFSLEGIQRNERSIVLGSTIIKSHIETFVAPEGHEVTNINLKLIQSARKPVNKIQIERFEKAFDLGLKVLPVTRLGVPRGQHNFKMSYVEELSSHVLLWKLDRGSKIISAIEARGCGAALVRRIAYEIQMELGGHGSLFYYLGKPRSRIEAKKINRAVNEWCDGDSVASHFAYNNDLFCTEDFGKSASGATIFESKNRAWLTSQFGIRFVTMEQLVNVLSDYN